jgi:4-amino-4-deoxy-L-arabinose transferase-like glycosyltransferase
MPLLQFVVVAWLPGAVVFRLPWLSRERRAALAAEERLYWAVMISAAISLAVVLTLAAAHRYSFQRLLIADLAIGAGLALAGRFDLRLGPAARHAGLGAGVALAIALLGAWRFLPTSEYIIGGKDPGVYINEGIQIGQRGAIAVEDPVVAAVPPFARDLFFPADTNKDYYLSVRFMGFFVRSPEPGLVIGQFQHAFPASVAIGYGIDGLTGARCAVAFWGVLGLLSVYFAGARLFGRPAAAAAAVLLALNVVQVWFARYPNIEMLLQTLLFAALLANARAHVDDDPFFAPVAGVLTALLLFARFDAAIALAGFVAALTLAYAARQRGARWTFTVPLAAGVALCAWYLAGPMWPYAELPFRYLMNLPAWGHAAIAIALLTFAALVVAARRSAAVSTRITSMVPVALTVVVVTLAAYGLLWRQPGGALAVHDASALRTFADFYVTRAVLIAAVVGYVIFAPRLFWRDPAFFLILTGFALIFFYKIRIVPEHFWAARRFVPIILPGTLLLAAAAALSGARGGLLLTRAVRTPIGIIFLALVAVHYARAAEPVVAHVEYAGVIPRIEALAGQLADDDLLIVESRDAGSDVHVFALPLAYTYARQVLVLSSAAPDKATFAAFLEHARTRYRRVLFLGSGGSDLLSTRWTVTPIDSVRFQIPEYESRRNAYPRLVQQKEFDYSVYRFGPPSTEPPSPVLDIGISDDLHAVRFHAKEQTEGRTFRWTQARSFVIVNRISATDRALVFTMGDGGRPPAAPPADVAVWIGERVLGTIEVRGGFRDYEVPIPADVAAAAAAGGEPVRVMLRTVTWNPLTVLGTDDPRDLGVMLDRVAVR